jgi:hypothetical protein
MPFVMSERTARELCASTNHVLGVPELTGFVERYSRKLATDHVDPEGDDEGAAGNGNIRELESIIERDVILCPGPVTVVAIWIRTNHFTTNLQRGVTVMKKRNIVIHFLVLLMLIATFAACASTRTHDSASEYVDDSVITTKVKALLAEDDFLKSFQISVESFKGTVQLSGFVNSQKAVDKAGEIVRSVKGVRSIKNNLIVK